MRSGGPEEFPIRNFRGVNRKDATDRILDTQFNTTQNFYQLFKGVFQKRFGTTQDQLASVFVGASRVSALHRHHNPNKEKYTLYFCEPDSTNLPDNTVDLTLADIAGGGDIFGGGAVVPLYVCYSFYGWGQEQTYNTKNRGGFTALPVNSWLQAGHQTITLAANTNTLRVTAPPTFPTGVRGCNIFVARGGASTAQMTYMGSITTPSGTLNVKRFIGPTAARNDAFGTLTCTSASGGSLKPGTYFVSIAWVTDPAGSEGAITTAINLTSLKAALTVTVPGENGSIQVTHSLAASTNGAKSCYVFIGFKDEKSHPMTCVGIINSTDTLTITSIPDNLNAQSHPELLGSDTNPATFDPHCKAASVAITARLGFILKKDTSNVISEILPSRTLVVMALQASSDDPIYGSSSVSLSQLFYLGYPKSANDKWNGSQPYNWGRTVYDPVFAYLNGLSYFANGVDIPWQTDGKGLGQIARANGTLLPPYPRFIAAFQNSLIVTGSEAKNQVYSSNALQPQNWASGGTGTGKKFIGIGDLFGDENTALGVFTLATDGTNDPRSFIIAFKKHGCWMKDTIPDPVGGVGSPMQQLSGRTGCIAYRSIVSTTLGLVFMGQDGDIYLINGPGEPKRIGTIAQNFFSHLVNNESLMMKVTAVFHDNHLKISYPSSATSTFNDAQVWADFRTGPGDPINWFGPHTGINIGAQIVLTGESDDNTRWGVQSDAVGTVKLDDPTVMTDLGTPVVGMLEWKTSRFGREAHNKRFFGALIDMFFDSQFAHNILFEGFADNYYQAVPKPLSPGAGSWGVGSWNVDSYQSAIYAGVECYFGPTNLVGRAFKWRLTHSNASQVLISSINLLLKVEKKRLI